jgi:hypothetical protein
MDDVVFLGATKRGACWTVTGKVFKHGQWLDASFTTLAQDVEHMSREDFVAFALRRFPEVAEDMRYNPITGDVLV